VVGVVGTKRVQPVGRPSLSAVTILAASARHA
jgi:hypothetical protein